MARGLALAAWLLALWGAAAAAYLGQPPSTVALCVAAAFVPYGWLVAVEARLEVGVLMCLVLAAGLPMLVAPVALSDDVYRYLWDARVLRAGIDPYLYAPADPSLAFLRDALWREVNHPEVPTIYPPVAQGLFVVADVLGHAPWSPRLLMLAAHLGLVPLLASRAPGWATGAWALNPLALEESALGGHLDVLVGGALLAGALALEVRRPARAVLALLVASGLKLVGVVLAPLLGRERRLLAFGALALVALPVWPLLGAGAGSGTVGGLGQYARRWRGNAGLYAGVEELFAAALGGADGAASGRVRLDSLRPVFEALADTPFDPRASFLPEKKPIADVAEFEVHVLAAVLARASIALALLGLAFGLAFARVAPLTAARALLWATLLLAPQVHPWYLLWLLPIELAVGRVSGLVWSAAILVAYAPLDGWVARREWQEAGQGLQYVLVLVALLGETWLLRRLPREAPGAPPEAAAPASS